MAVKKTGVKELAAKAAAVKAEEVKVEDVKKAEPAKKPETKKADTSEAEIKPVETPAPTPTTSAKKVGDSVTLADGFNGTIKSIPKAGVYEVALENGQTGIYTDADLVTGQPETTPEPITQSPTGGNEQNTQVTPNREEEQGGRFSVNKSAVDKVTIDDFTKIHTSLTDAGKEELTDEVNATSDYLNGKTSAKDYLKALGYSTGENSWLDSKSTTKEDIQKEVDRKAKQYEPYIIDNNKVDAKTYIDRMNAATTHAENDQAAQEAAQAGIPESEWMGAYHKNAARIAQEQKAAAEQARQQQEQTGATEQETRITEPDTPEQEEKKEDRKGPCGEGSSREEGCRNERSRTDFRK